MYLYYLANICTSAALLGGFSFSLLGGVGNGGHVVLEGFYLSFGVLSFGTFMYVVICASTSAQLAPRKAFQSKEISSVASVNSSVFVA